MDWHLAPSLATLRSEIDGRWPHRSKVSDGTIGDPAHSARASDHNPNRRGSVNAIDVTNEGIDVGALIRAAVAHPSTAYVISRGVIRSRTYGFSPRPYSGDNPHDKHVHISIQQTRTAEQSERSWFTRDTFPLPDDHTYGTPRSQTVHDGSEGPVTADNVRLIQRRLRVAQTGRYGRYTALRVRAFQVWKRLGVTGEVGPQTWRAMRL